MVKRESKVRVLKPFGDPRWPVPALSVEAGKTSSYRMDPCEPARHDGPNPWLSTRRPRSVSCVEVPTGVPTARKTRDFFRNHAMPQRPSSAKNPCKSIGSWPREESNLRTRIRSPPLYPLSYGALDRRKSRLRRSIFVGYWASNRSVYPTKIAPAALDFRRVLGLEPQRARPGKGRPRHRHIGG
jgi:hypothetical protein